MTMGAYPKFILTSDGHLRLGMVRMHRDLLLFTDHCVGGGYYQIDAMAGTLLLERESYDYGQPQWNRVTRIIVPREYEGLRLIYRYESWPYNEIDLTAMFTVTYE